MNVKRYEWVACDEHACHCDVVESAEGDMVDYEDYAALEARCAALAAENALLKKSEPAPFSKLMMEALDVYQAGADEVPELAMLSAYKKLRDGLKTPATDAFLAEVRAGAVDEVCLKISNAIVNCYQDEQIGLDAAATICGDFASGLRKGVQS
ncbi:TPA: hypothetical protein ACYRWO_000984 [Enterobacter hormaechei]|jgi:hypothetical protein|uniref:hypothetical protein n=1 Tax=Enterobacter hormaechei TaxID=158836 RepID=UPI00079992E4|nr:hypothetical protein [Enterobacter hormaechei]MCU2290200.1 hypothetical protein [Enterobacter hormaechei subsp. steigerwaltii]HBM2813509.1 hypothetical protein [Enterobacter hormaechei subsp. xiangfangensis]EKW1881342.1 hypothetical protein [Enterobacter hormaechei]MCB4923462.1 hypothetical protein [Enterobacter hormaechei]MCU2296919.1 hypothetical protein [Enterobacter hormaechei subsp. steigerwaltii]